jgi:hypothetical protein
MLGDLYRTTCTYKALVKDLQKLWKEELNMGVLFILPFCCEIVGHKVFQARA